MLHRLALVPLLGLLLGVLPIAVGLGGEDNLVVPWAVEHFNTDESCRKTAPPVVPVPVAHNDAYFAPPARGEDWPAWLESLRAYRREVRGRLHDTSRPIGFDDAIYRREDLRWTSRNFVCGFVFVFDRAFWDPERRRYRVEELLDDAAAEFGGYDSIVLWQAYPRIGADPRNQFDFFRDMPGGLDGVRDVLRRFHRRGVKVFVPYNPWDTGTRREPVGDEVALAELVARIEADGVFAGVQE